MRAIATAMVLAIASASGAIAAAEPSEPGEPSEAAELFLRGRELLKQGQRAEACELFDRSYQMDPAPGTGVNLAVCLEDQGQLRRAWELFDKVARATPNVQSRVQLARQRADALLSRLATVIVQLGEPRPAGLAIRLGDRELPVPGDGRQIRAIVEPGPIELVASAPGQPERRTALTALAGAEVVAGISGLVAQRRHPARLYAAGGIGLAGAVGLGVSLGFALAARRANHDAYDHGCARTDRGVVCIGPSDGINEGARLLHLAGARADLATGFAIGGAVLVGAAATLYLVSRDTVLLAPLASVDTLGVSLAGRF